MNKEIKVQAQISFWFRIRFEIKHETEKKNKSERAIVLKVLPKKYEKKNWNERTNCNLWL